MQSTQLAAGAAPDPNAECPDCGVAALNVQGVHACPDCDWTQVPLP